MLGYDCRDLKTLIRNNHYHWERYSYEHYDCLHIEIFIT